VSVLHSAEAGLGRIAPPIREIPSKRGGCDVCFSHEQRHDQAGYQGGFIKKGMIILDRSLIKKGLISTGFFINLGLLILCIFLLYVVSDYPDMARSFPRLVLMMILVVTAVDSLIMIRGGIEEKSSKKENESVSPGRSLTVFYMVVLMFVFYLFLNLFGLILAVLFFLLFSGWTLGYKNPKRLIISSVLITAFVYIIFQVIMNSILPEALIFTVIGD
jgi:hypothetical protein